MAQITKKARIGGYAIYRPIRYGRSVTVAVAVKVFDGIVLAADSATTIELANGSAQVYNNANKVFHLHRKHPVAAMTWGFGNVGGASISTLAKDLRMRFTGLDPDYADWELTDSYTVEEIAGRLVEHLHPLYAADHGQNSMPPPIGFLVAGYSSGQPQAEAWRIDISSPTTTPVPVSDIPQNAAGWISYAQPEATQRLFTGIDPRFVAAMRDLLDPAEWAKIEPILKDFHRQPAIPSMPLGDAIALAKFLVEVTAGYSHFLLGPDTVGGPIEVASISRHEGFKWISRKHYYSLDLNPEGPNHAC
jgi:hypothetical protein